MIKERWAFRGVKRQGEWAELVFMALAAFFGFNVSRPWGDSAQYDVSVEYQGRFLRVQVKSTRYRRRGREYSLNVMGPGRRPYEKGLVDFIAVYLIPEDAWYIIPFAEVDGHCTLHFRPGRERQRWERYREAWELLKEESLVASR